MTNRTPPPYPQINAKLSARRVLDWLSGFNFLNGFPPPNQRIYHGAVAGAAVGGDPVNTDCSVGSFAGWGRGTADLPSLRFRGLVSGLMPPNADFYSQLFLRHLSTHGIMR